MTPPKDRNKTYAKNIRREKKPIKEPRNSQSRIPNELPLEEKPYPPEFSHNKQLTANQKRFLMVYMQCGHITRSAKYAGVNRMSHHVCWMKQPEYVKWFRWSKREALDRLEEEALRRATEGDKQYKFTKSGDPLLHPLTGEPYYEIVRSDRLLMFMLSANRKKKFGQSGKMTLDGSIKHEGGLSHTHIAGGIPLDKLSVETKRQMLLEIEAIEKKAELEDRRKKGEIVDVEVVEEETEKED